MPTRGQPRDDRWIDLGSAGPWGTAGLDVEWVSQLPWRAIRHLYRVLRRRFFRDTRSEVPTLRLTAGVEEIQRVLGQRHFEPNWEFSAYYAGEDLNVRRVSHTDRELPWWQTHVRGFETATGVELDPHWEPEPTQHPDAHLADDAYIEFDPAIDTVTAVLDEAGLGYELLDPAE